MIIRKLIVLLCLVNTLSNCSPTKQHTRYKFAREEFTISQPTDLRTDGVYIYSGRDYYGDSFYAYIRFFANGRCFFSNIVKENISDSVLKSTRFQSGEQTYYRNNSNEITIENWDPYSGYGYLLGTISGSTLKLTGDSSRHQKKANRLPAEAHSIYQFKPLILAGNADW